MPPMINFECKVTNTSPIRRELTISVEPDSIQKYISKGLNTVQKTAKLKGFRPGKVPMTLIKQYYLGDVKSDVFSKVVRDSYLKALEDNKIAAVGMPEIEPQSGVSMNEGEKLTFVARFEVYPQIELSDLKKIKITKPSVEVKEEDIEKSMENLRNNHAETLPDSDNKGPAKTGDFVEITFKGLVDGEGMTELNGENRLVEIGTKSYMEEFENGIIGMKKGEEKTFPVTFAKDFTEPKLAGKTVDFTVTLHEFKKKTLPLVDDEFAKRFKLETAKELREKIVETMKEDREKESKNDLRENLFKALAEKHPFEVPTSLVTTQMEYLDKENTEYLKRNGFTPKMIQDYLEKNQTQMKERAETQVRVALILDKIAQENDIKVKDADLDREFAKIGESMKLGAEQIREVYKSDENAMRQIRYRVKEDQTLDYILSQVQVTVA